MRTNVSQRTFPRLPGVAGKAEQRPLRVCIVGPELLVINGDDEIGGAFATLGLVLAKAGHQVTYLHLGEMGGGHSRSYEGVKESRQRGIEWVHLPQNESSNLDVAPHMVTSCAIYHWLKHNDPFDVIHFPAYLGLGYYSLLAKRQGLAFERTIFAVNADTTSALARAAQQEYLSRLTELDHDFMERESVALGDVVIGSSQYALNWLAERGWKLPSAAYVQPTLLAQPSQPSAKTAMAAGLQEITELVFYSCPQTRCGLQLFCDALEQLPAAAGEKIRTVTFLGKESNVDGAATRTWVEKYARRWPWKTQVLAEQAAGPAIEYLRQRGRLVVFPYGLENSPYPIGACLGAQIPFLTSRVGGIPEMMAPEDTDWACFEPKPQALAKQLTKTIIEGGRPARPAVESVTNERVWVAWHESLRAEGGQAVGPLPAPEPQVWPKVSVCLTTFNRPSLLRQALASLERQDYKNFEVVLVDDGSQNADALAYLQEIAPAFTQRGWQIVRQDNRYLGAARNTAARQATGEFLLFMDDDNFAEPTEITLLVKAACRTGADIVCCGLNFFSGLNAPDRQAGPERRWLPLGGAAAVGVFRNCFGDANALVRRTCFESVGGFTEDYGVTLEDWEFHARAVLKGFTLTVIPEFLFWYRVNSTSMIHTTNRYRNQMRSIRPYVESAPLPLRDLLYFLQGQHLSGVASTSSPDSSRMAEEGSAPKALPSQEEFDEVKYLTWHGDVAEAIREGHCASGWRHFVEYGFAEKRRWFRREPVPETKNPPPLVKRSLGSVPSGSPSIQTDNGMKETGLEPTQLGLSAAPSEAKLASWAGITQGLQNLAQQGKAPQDKTNESLDLAPAATSYDILVPIYNAPDDVRRCIESLLRHTEPRHTIYLLDDASPDPRVAPLLQSIAVRHAQVKVVKAERNGGFILNMNRGFSLSHRDVVILNSDTEVTAGWLERLDRCRRSDPAIGIVSPLSNNATILSVPTMNARNALAPGMTPDRFAALVATHSERLYPRIPTAVGFCMLITRATLDAVGTFDPSYGLGYGEENDFCLRAWAKGFESVCCDDAYVHHYGEASFGQVEHINERRRHNAELLSRRWPHYLPAVYRYCQRNPLRKLQERLRIAVRPAPAATRPHVLHVLHNFHAPGGTELHTQDMIQHLSNRWRSTVLFPGPVASWTDFFDLPARTASRELVFNQVNVAASHCYVGKSGDLANPLVEANFRQLLAGGDYDLIHFQHLAGWSSLRLPRIAKQLGKRCILSIHDYFLLCPEYNLVDSELKRCGKPYARETDPVCLECLKAKRLVLKRGVPLLSDYLRQRQELVREVMTTADAVVVPSNFVRDALLRAFGSELANRVHILTHGIAVGQRALRAHAAETLRIGVLGNLSPRKGLLVLLEAVQLLRGLPLSFEVFGHIPPAAREQMKELCVREHGGYSREQLPKLLQEVDLVLILSVWDETFCLTLSEAQAVGVPVLASSVGAIAERIHDGQSGFLFSPPTGAALAAKLRELCSHRDKLETVEQVLRRSAVKSTQENAEDYDRLYRQVLPSVSPKKAAPSFSGVPVGLEPCDWTWQETAFTDGTDQEGLTSIIILSYNQIEHTRRCLESIVSHTGERYELILVDNGSSDGTVAWLREFAAKHSQARLITNASNRGFAAGNNQGLAIAQGNYVLLLNNDTVVTPGWLGRLLQVLKTNPKVGLVGPMSNCVSGPQLVPNACYQGLEALSAFATGWAVEYAGQMQEVSRLVGFCLLVRREVIKIIGGLDEGFGSGNFEDDDFCLRARLAGFRVLIAKEAFVHHVGSQTFKGARIDYRQAMLRNWEIFRTKWQLPPEASLERGYVMPNRVPAGVALKVALPSLTASHQLEGQLFWTEKAPVRPAAPVKMEIPAVAQVGNLDEARAGYGRRDLATAWTRTLAALQARPFHPEAYLMLAEIAQAAGDAAAARRCAQHASTLAPEWKPAKRFLKGHLRGNTKPTWLVLPDTLIASLAIATPRISVCLITKNEEKFIGQCLASVRGLADQIVVVDTGSIDRTIEIAKEHGAEVHTFTWCDDFSAARNAALEHARGDWVLILDADEELPPDQHDRLRADLTTNKIIAYRLPIINRGQESEGQGFVPRLFRNAPGIHFRGRIHEQVFPSLIPLGKTWGLNSGFGTAQLVHHGYAKAVIQERNKVERNLKLLRQAVEEYPEDANLAMNLGLELVRSGELQTGLAHYRQAFQLMSRQAPAEVPPELREVLLTQFASHLRSARALDEAVQVLTSPLARSGSLTASMHLALGLSFFELNQPAEAAEQMRQCLAKVDQPTRSPINPEIRTAVPHHCLALCLAKLGDVAGAEKAFQAGLAKPNRVEALRLDYAKFLVDQKRPVDAFHRLHELVAENAQNAMAWQLGGQIALSQPEFLEFACDWTGEAIQYLPGDKAILAQRAEALLLSRDTVAARALWEQLYNAEREPRSLAGLILCEILQGPVTHMPQGEWETVAASRAFIDWYRKCLSVGAKETVLKLNTQTEELKQVLPEAARILEVAFAEAERPEAAECCPA